MYKSYSAEKDHYGGKNPFIEFPWIGHYNIEKELPNNTYLERKIGTNKTQVLHRMGMRLLTPCQPPGDIRITPQEWKTDPKVSLKHDDLYARTGECKYEQPIFDAQNIHATPPNPRDIPVQPDLSTEGLRKSPRTAHECSTEIFSQKEELSDVTGTYPDMEPDVGTTPEQPNNSMTNPRNSK